MIEPYGWEDDIESQPFTLQDFLLNCWTYYQEIKSQVSTLRRYISFSKKNNSAFSVETLKLLQVTCSEVGVFAKQVSFTVNSNSCLDDFGSILLRGLAVCNALPVICCVEFQVVNSGCVMQPWKGWRFHLNPNKGKVEWEA